MIVFRNKAYYLSAAYRSQLKSQIHQNSNSSPTINKIKYFLKEFKYVFSSGHAALLSDLKWYRGARHKSDLTAYETFRIRKINQALRRYVPYLFFLTVPGSSSLLPFYLYLFPHAAPMHFTFDVVYQKRLKQRFDRQGQAYNNMKLFVSIPKKNSIIELHEFLKSNMNFESLTSDQWITVGDFLAAEYYTGTASINKLANIFTWIIPSALKKVWWFFRRIIQPNYEYTEFARWKDLSIFKFNFFPFERIKVMFIRQQINRFVKATMEADQAARRSGLADQSRIDLVEYCLERSIPCLFNVQEEAKDMGESRETLVRRVNSDWLPYVVVTVEDRICLSVACYHYSRSGLDL